MKKIILIGIISWITFCALVGYGVSALLSDNKQVINENVSVNFKNTLWETVSDTMDKYNDQRDIREVIFETDKINGFKGNDYLQLNNNDIIVVPVQYEKENEK